MCRPPPVFADVPQLCRSTRRALEGTISRCTQRGPSNRLHRQARALRGQAYSRRWRSLPAGIGSVSTAYAFGHRLRSARRPRPAGGPSSGRGTGRQAGTGDRAWSARTRRCRSSSCLCAAGRCTLPAWGSVVRPRCDLRGAGNACVDSVAPRPHARSAELSLSSMSPRSVPAIPPPGLLFDRGAEGRIS